MISIKLMGGLGNVMFQIATIEYLGKAFNMDVTYTNVDAWIEDLKDNYFWSRHAEDYLTIFPNLNLYKNHDKRFVAKRRADVVFRYRALEPEDGDLFIAYFQSEQNFGDRAFVFNLFQPSDYIKEKVATYDNMFGGTTCSIHVRRCAYLNWQEFHPALDIEYYNKAIKILAPLKIDRFLVFGDSIDWCRNNFHGDKFVFIKDVDYVDLFLMAKCEHHIISNSSLAWWGAWLGEKTGSKIIAPVKWFGKCLPEDYDGDIIPGRWEKL